MNYLFRDGYRLWVDRRGAAALQFAIIAPLFFAMLFGIVQLGILFHAQAGLRNAVEDAARYATLWPKPTDAQIRARISSNSFGLKTANIVGPAVSFSTGASPNYVTISMTYNITIDYVIGSKTISLSETRRAFTIT